MKSIDKNVLMVRSLVVRSQTKFWVIHVHNILRFGSQDLFKNEDEDSTKDVDYTDELVAALLKRED